MNASETPPLIRLMTSYKEIHGYLSLVVSSFGVFINVVNIVVLSNKRMSSSPINRLLQAIAVADLVIMLLYIPYSIRYYIAFGSEASPERNTYSAAQYLMFHAALSSISHTCSILLTVCVALFRYLYLSLSKGKKICDMKSANICIAVAAVLSVVLNIPQLLVMNVVRYPRQENATWYRYHLNNDGMGEEMSKTINLIQYVILAVLVKIGPNIALVLLSILLIRIILKAQRKYNNMQRNSTKDRSASARRREQTHQTTKLLVAIAMVFTLAELPQGVLFVLSGVNINIMRNIYHPLGNLLDLLVIVTCMVNFFLYYAMSTQFRQCLKEMFHIDSLFKFCFCKHWRTDNSNGTEETKETIAPERVGLMPSPT